MDPRQSVRDSLAMIEVLAVLKGEVVQVGNADLKSLKWTRLNPELSPKEKVLFLLSEGNSVEKSIALQLLYRAWDEFDGKELLREIWNSAEEANKSTQLSRAIYSIAFIRSCKEGNLTAAEGVLAHLVLHPDPKLRIQAVLLSLFLPEDNQIRCDVLNSAMQDRDVSVRRAVKALGL